MSSTLSVNNLFDTSTDLVNGIDTSNLSITEDLTIGSKHTLNYGFIDVGPNAPNYQVFEVRGDVHGVSAGIANEIYIFIEPVPNPPAPEIMRKKEVCLALNSTIDNHPFDLYFLEFNNFGNPPDIDSAAAVKKQKRVITYSTASQGGAGGGGGHAPFSFQDIFSGIKRIFAFVFQFFKRKK